MKKLAILTLMPILLAGCNKGGSSSSDVTYKDLKIMAPKGAPAIALSAFSDLKGFDTNKDPSIIQSMMVNEQIDVAVLPTNVGVNLINKQNVKYKMLCTITFGNFFIGATGHDDNGVMDADDYIVIFQHNAVPGKVFHYVYGDTLNSALHEVGTNEDARSCLLSGTHKPDDVTYNVDYVVISEPALTAVMGQNASRSQYKNLTEEYVTKSEGLLLPQASVFVRSSLDQEKIIDPFYEALSSSINQMINSPDLVESNMNKDDDPQALFSVVPAVAKVVTANGNRMGLGCKQASQIKSDINQFLSLFGVSELKDESIAK